MVVRSLLSIPDSSVKRIWPPNIRFVLRIGILALGKVSLNGTRVTSASAKA